MMYIHQRRRGDDMRIYLCVRKQRGAIIAGGNTVSAHCQPCGFLDQTRPCWTSYTSPRIIAAFFRKNAPGSGIKGLIH
jgi:hypothetical protein